MFYLFFILLILFDVHAAFEMPKNLNSQDRKLIVKSLGIPSSTKFLSNPYPLGGYSGVEIGISYQFIDIDDVSELGDTANNDKTLALAELSFGKGLYSHVDIFFNLAPLNHADNIHTYGGIIKWGFYQAKFLPLSFSLLLSSSVFQAGEAFVNQTLGIDLISGFNVDNMAVYFGFGQLQAEAKFLGGPGDFGILPAGETIAREKQFMNHMIFGLNFRYSNLFIAAQMDRFEEPVMSGKIGLRF